MKARLMLNMAYCCPECVTKLTINISESRGVAELNHGPMPIYESENWCSRYSSHPLLKMVDTYSAINEGDTISLLHLPNRMMCSSCIELHEYYTIQTDGIRVKYHHHPILGKCKESSLYPIAKFTIFI